MIQLKNNKSIKEIQQYGLQSTLDKLYNDSLNNANFKNLVEIITSEENILLAYRQICKNSGAYTPGVDGRTIENLGKLDSHRLVKLIKNKFKYYKPNAVKRVYIPKSSGKMRPLGIPTIADRLMQQCILQVMEPIAETKFYKGSYGFRPYKSTHNAIADLYKKIQIQNLHYLVDVDIKGFFDNVNHKKLMRQLWSLGIHDKKLLKIINLMLKAEIVDVDGTITKPNKGTPQGGILSPLLANIVLNEFDWWVVSQWEEIPTKHNYQGYRHKDGTRSKNPKYNALRNKSNLKEVYIVRYADDFKLICRNYKDARNIKIAAEKWINERLHLETAPEKTRITNLKKNYSEFLGPELSS